MDNHEAAKYQGIISRLRAKATRQEENLEATKAELNHWLELGQDQATAALKAPKTTK